MTKPTTELTEEVASLRIWLRILTTALVLVFVIAVSASALSVSAYVETKRPEVPAPVVVAVQTDDVDLLMAKAIIGDTQIELRNLIDLYERQAALFGLTMDRLVEEIRKEKTP